VGTIATATVMDSNPGTLHELVARTRELCSELFDAAGWKILSGETVTKGDQLSTVSTYEIEPAGQLTIERSAGYAGDDDFVFVEIVGWGTGAEATEHIRVFLTGLTTAQEIAFGSRVMAWV
jgi:hypothetical protein